MQQFSGPISTTSRCSLQRILTKCRTGGKSFTIPLFEKTFFFQKRTRSLPTNKVLFVSRIEPQTIRTSSFTTCAHPMLPGEGIDYKDWRKLTRQDYKGRYDRYPSVVPICVVANLLTFKRYGLLPRVHVLKR